MASLFFSNCTVCGDPTDASWWIGPDISAVPLFEVTADGSHWTSPDLGSLHFTGYAMGTGLIFQRDGDWLLLDTRDRSPAETAHPAFRPGAAGARLEACGDSRMERSAASQFQLI